jgi:hypothetical protein
MYGLKPVPSNCSCGTGLKPLFNLEWLNVRAKARTLQLLLCTGLKPLFNLEWLNVRAKARTLQLLLCTGLKPPISACLMYGLKPGPSNRGFRSLELGASSCQLLAF